MLPPQLSEDALSLVPDADRDALTVEMRIAPDGTVTAADVYATRIRSNTRLSYETAAAVLAGQRPEEVAYDASAAGLQQVWIAVRASLRDVLENTTIAHLASGRLPRQVTARSRDSEAWAPH